MSNELKSEEPKYFIGLQHRLAKLDCAKCISVAKEQIRNTREKSGGRMFMPASIVEKEFGILKRDLYALVEIEGIKGYDDEELEEIFFLADDICGFFERSAEIRATKEQTSGEIKAKGSACQITEKAA